MDKSHVLAALFRKYCHLMGELKRHPDRAVEIRQNMVHLEATIRLFRPDADLSKLRPIVLEVMKHAGLPTDDKKAVAAVCSSIHMSILRRKGRGIVAVEGRPRRWAISDFGNMH